MTARATAAISRILAAFAGLDAGDMAMSLR
jgi:chaperonin GroEL (HSP60 family)